MIDSHPCCRNSLYCEMSSDSDLMMAWEFSPRSDGGDGGDGGTDDWIVFGSRASRLLEEAYQKQPTGIFSQRFNPRDDLREVNFAEMVMTNTRTKVQNRIRRAKLSPVEHSTSLPPAFVKGKYNGRRKAMYYDFDGPKGAGYYAGTKEDKLEPQAEKVCIAFLRLNKSRLLRLTFG